jgi:hypothetical protein
MWRSSPYAYAKASWIIGKSFLGKRMASLNGIHTLNELDRLVFPDNFRELPGKELLVDIEKRIAQRAQRQISSVINSFAEPPKFLIRMQSAESSQAITSRGQLHETSTQENTTNYYRGLIESLWQLDSEDRELAAKLISDEISLLNSSYVLRLRTYYQKNEVEISRYLMDSRLLGSVYQKGIAAEVKTAMEFSLDIRQEWKGWRWERFLNTDEGSSHWIADPRHFQNAASWYLYQRSLHNFHSLPMSVSAIYCFIKLKHFEKDFLTSVAEGLALGMDSSSVFKLFE